MAEKTSVDGIMEKAMGSMASGIRVGENPSKEDIREEVSRLAAQGKTGAEVGQQIGPYFMTSDAHGQRELDLLEDVLAEEFEDYGN